ncbi:hypothetical protein ACFWUW_12740 [Streptomyces sp. NPDC058655]|uniref:hypothetical protein n=1 Tax=unclassified Streptomyces TaxID=2593676 RepID=UPI0036504058
MNVRELRSRLLALAREAGLPGAGVGVRRIVDTGPPPYVPDLDRGFRVSPRRRREYLAGRAAAADALAGLGLSGYPVARTPRGVPIWPPGLAGSISHSAHWAVAIAVSADVAAHCGIDVEEPADQADPAALELHSAREAVYKAMSPGSGLSFHPEQWPLTRSTADGRWTVGQLPLGPSIPRLVSFSSRHIHVSLAVCDDAAGNSLAGVCGGEAMERTGPVPPEVGVRALFVRAMPCGGGRSG